MKTYTAILILFLGLPGFAQNYFDAIKQVKINNGFMADNQVPEVYKTYKVNYQKIKETLRKAPDLLSVKSSNVSLSIPDENGIFQTYSIYQSFTLSDELCLKTNIRTYRIKNLKNPAQTGSLTLTPYGLYIAIYRAGAPALYLQTVNRNQEMIVYNKSAIEPKIFSCMTTGYMEHNSNLTKNVQIDDEILRIYRFAIGTTGEYSAYHIQNAIDSGVITSDASDEEKKEVVLSAVTITLDRVNSIYERDFGVSLSLVSNEEDVIFLDADTDPYDNDDITSMAEDNTDVLNDYIGSANYDGGHLFSTYPNGGLSALGIICGPYKAASVTGSAEPAGDAYDVDFVAHEIGHAFGCNHTFANSCSNNRNAATAVEPGSGNSIMAYAGVCSPNIQDHSDDYFHGISIDEATDFVTNSATCSTNIDSGNHAPEISVVNYGDVYIPQNTAFMLQASATDADDDALTYCWEQTDYVTDTSIYSWYPDAEYDNGPLFKSYPPVMNGTRYFPVLTDILNGNYQNTWEVLPEVNRDLNFKVTVRDNHESGGQSPNTTLAFKVDETAGPFRITNMSTDNSYEAGSEQTITWEVANTDNDTVNCQGVDILFSIDDGETFPYVIAENVPNSGSAEITIPEIEDTTLGRFMVKAHNNYFFDITQGKISVTGILDNESNLTKIYPNPAQKSINISFKPLEPEEKIDVKIIDLSGKIILWRSYNGLYYFMQNINVSNLHNGVYLVQIINGKDKKVKKLIIQKNN